MRTVGFFTDGHGRAQPALYLRPTRVPPGRACVPCPPGPCAARSAGKLDIASRAQLAAQVTRHRL